MAWTTQLERAAADGKSIPSGLTTGEMALYVAIRGLYSQVRSGAVDKETARKEKKRLITEFSKVEGMLNTMERSRKALAWLNVEFEEGDCPKCRELKKMIMQLENCF